MTHTTPRNGRPPDKRDEVVHSLREDIISGKWAPGAALPSHQQLVAQFCVASTAIQGAMHVLQEDGFIVTERRRGSFVAKHPPHLSHYSLVFPHPEYKIQESKFYTAILAEAKAMDAPDCRFSCFFNIGDSIDTGEYYRLITHIRARRLTGAIFTFNPAILPESLAPLVALKQAGIPSVVLALPEIRIPCPTVYPDLGDFTKKALQYLTTHNRCRIAHLLLATSTNEADCIPRDLSATIRSFGLDLARPWIQAVPAPATDWARHVVRLLFDAGPTKRPNALVIHDDNLVPAATQGLVEAGLKVPDDVEVVALANFPWPTPAAVPATRLGFDITNLIHVCRDRIAQQRAGRRTPSATLVPACFECGRGDRLTSAAETDARTCAP